MITDTNIPLAVRQHWASIPNCVDALYCTFQRRQFPWDLREEKMDAMGQLGNDHAAAGCAAIWLMGHKSSGSRVRNWKYISWRVTGNVDNTSGFAPKDFAINKKYYSFWAYPDGEKTIEENKILACYGEVLDEPRDIALLYFLDKLKFKYFS